MLLPHLQKETRRLILNMSLWILVAFYLIIAGCEISRPERCLYFFERLTSDAKRIRLLSLLAFLIALLCYTAEPKRLQWLISILFWIYLVSGIWFLTHPQSFVSLCNKSYTTLAPSEKRTILYVDCAIRTLLALLLIYSIL